MFFGLLARQVCTDSLVPEFWMLRYPATAPPGTPNLASCSVVGFVAGTHMEACAGKTPQQLVDGFVAQLDQIFGTPAVPKPATAALVRSHVIDWSKQPWIRGAYT
jgi:monoamine oxidase